MTKAGVTELNHNYVTYYTTYKCSWCGHDPVDVDQPCHRRKLAEVPRVRKREISSLLQRTRMRLLGWMIQETSTKGG